MLVDEQQMVASQVVEGDRNGLMAHVEYGAWCLTLFVLSRLPRFAFEWFQKGLARFLKLVDRRHAASARGFIAQAFSSRGQQLDARQIEARVLTAYQHLIEIALTPARVKRRFGHNPEALLERTEVHMSAPVREAMEAGGCVIVSAHVGDWEMAAQICAAVGFQPFYVISKPPRNRPMSKSAQVDRERGGIRLLPRRGAMGFAPRVIKSGGFVGMLLDQRARVKPVIAPFFGRPARCDRSAGVLMKRLKCPVVFVAAYRTGDLRWRLEAKRVLTPKEIGGMSPAEIAGLVNAELEEQIMSAPDQQFWLHDRFRDTPVDFEG